MAFCTSSIVPGFAHDSQPPWKRRKMAHDHGHDHDINDAWQSQIQRLTMLVRSIRIRVCFFFFFLCYSISALWTISKTDLLIVIISLVYSASYFLVIRQTDRFGAYRRPSAFAITIFVARFVVFFRHQYCAA